MNLNNEQREWLFMVKHQHQFFDTVGEEWVDFNEGTDRAALLQDRNCWDIAQVLSTIEEVLDSGNFNVDKNLEIVRTLREHWIRFKKGTL